MHAKRRAAHRRVEIDLIARPARRCAAGTPSCAVAFRRCVAAAQRCALSWAAAARRHRSIGGKVMKMALHDMGRMGVGLVIGDNNVTGISLHDASGGGANGGQVQTDRGSSGPG